MTHLYFCLADHFEPAWCHADPALQLERVRHWIAQYPAIAARHHDCDGRPPQHTFFYPQEAYSPACVAELASLCTSGWGDVEVHLHHDHDTPASLTDNLARFIDTLHNDHGLLRKDKEGRIRYGFAHGDWALNNALGDGSCCGVDNETSILLSTGCYADFTMPCGLRPAQTRKLNSIYYALPQARPRAHDAGPNARVGVTPPRGLLMIQGPLTIVSPDPPGSPRCGIEWADIGEYAPATPRRVRDWIDARVHVEGAPDHVAAKVTTHGAQDRNIQYLLGGGLEALWDALESAADDCQLHYVTAFELFLMVKKLEASDPNWTSTDGHRRLS